MSPQTIQALNQLNTLFYSQNAASFSATRQRPWAGWQKLVAYLPDQPFTLLDIGCGNGRFEAFLRSHPTKLASYMGIDSSRALLDDARIQAAMNYQRAFKQVDIVGTTNWFGMLKTFDVVVMLAVLHHLPSKQLRQNILKQVAELIKPGGVLLLSLWQYDADARFKHKIIPWDQASKIHVSELEAGDYLLSWNNDLDKKRYVHVFTETEIEDLVRSSGLSLVTAFNADGKSHTLNHYLILSKNTVQ